MKRDKANGSIWHVTDYKARFELRDDVKIGRQSPLAYAKLHVRPTDMAAVTYLRQLDRLRRREDGAELEGYWTRLLQHTSDADYARRGYLVNDRLQPADIEEIARDVLLCDAKKAAAALDTFCEVGLIERVKEPDWAERAAEGERIAEAAKKHKPRGKKSAEAGATAGAPERSGPDGNTLNAPSPSRTKLNGEKRNGREQKRNEIGIEGEASGTGNTREADPTADSPISPAKSDAGAGPPSSGREACPASILAAGVGPPGSGREGCPTLGHVVKLNQYRYDPEAWAFADGVQLASGYRESNGAGRECERAHWAKAWADATAELPAGVCGRLKRAIVEQAAEIHGRRTDFKNPEAYLMRSWHNNVRDARRGRRETRSG